MNLGDRLGSMAARVFVLLCVGIVTAAALAFTASDIQRRATERRDREQRLVERTTDLVDVLQRAPQAVRPQLLGIGPEAARFAAGRPPGEEIDTDLTAQLRARLHGATGLEASLPSATACALVPAPPRPPPPPLRPPPLPPPEASGPGAPPAPPAPPAADCRRIALTLDGSRRIALIVPAGPRPRPEGPTPFSPLMLAVLATGAAALALMTAMLTTAPVRRMTAAAESLGRDLDRPPLREQGPTEVRQGARAFNAMQAQLKRREAERIHMLAAITHDLQTPLTRQRLRLEKVSDPDLRAALVADQAAMMELIRDGLELARAADAKATPLRALDLDSLLQSLCEDAVEAGAGVEVKARCGLVVRTQPEALKRCLANLLDNALKHAGAAELSCSVNGDAVELQVCDRGPGIPDAQLTSVLDPFVRLETSRSRDTGGAGLGLTIARLMAERAHGQLRLENRVGGGLRAVVRLCAT